MDETRTAAAASGFLSRVKPAGNHPRMPSAANVTAQNSAIADSTTADEAEAMTADAYALVCVVT